MMLVTVEQAKERLRVTHDTEDADLTNMIEGASAAVLNYLGIDGSAFYVPTNSESEVSSSESDPQLVVPAEVQTATLILVGMLYRDRDGVEAKDWEHGYLPKPVTAFLYPLRDPAMG